MFSSCQLFEWDVEHNQYIAYIENQTDTDIRVVIGENLIYRSLDTVIVSGAKVIYTGAPSVREGESNDDVVKKHLFGGEYYRENHLVRLFQNDVLVAEWEGPAEDKGEAHHFFNYNSWNVVKTNNEYDLTFTIYESDLAP